MTGGIKTGGIKTALRGRGLASSALVGLLALLAVGYLIRSSGGDGDGTATSTVPGPIQLDSCNGTPPFVTDRGWRNPQFATATRDSQGLVMLYEEAGGGSGVFVDPSWTAFGDLGTIAIAATGEVFTISRPNVDVLQNPPEQRNTIFRIDPDTGVMAPWADLPLEHDPLGQPFGLMGLTVDCLADQLYASSLSGSDADTEAGTIWRIDRATAEPTLIREGFDATALAVGTSLGRRHLVAGSGRVGALFSAPLDDDLDRPGLLVSISGPGSFLSVRAIKLRPDPAVPGRIDATVVDFDYSLRALPADAGRQVTFEWTPDGFRQLS